MAKRIVRATRQVAARRSLAVVLPGGELEELLYGKWLDPIMGVFAAYELFRRGEPASGGQLREVIRNMRQFFPELPDVAALEHLIGSATGPLPRAPLVLDGFLGLAVADRPAVLPVDRLDYRGPWTSWINAVEPPGPAGG